MANLERYVAEIESAQQAVADAVKAYRKGGSLSAVNRANDRLADAHDAYRDCSGGRIPTK